MRVEIDSALTERAVEWEMRRVGSAAYWRRRDALYDLADPDERERQFAGLNRRTFVKLGLDQTVHQALAEYPLLAEHAAVCRVLPALRKKEGAELFVAPGATTAQDRRVVLRLCPETLARPEALLLLLRHELFHIADMLDPAFGYDPALPDAEGGPMHVSLIIDRYRVVWDTVIDGRLWQAGRAPGAAREARRREFCKTFAMLGEGVDDAFEVWFGRAEPTHADILGFARAPSAGRTTGGLCPLCACPFVLGVGQEVPPVVERAVQEDFPTWSAADGICQQCLDLYGASVLSRSAARKLPQVRAS